MFNALGSVRMQRPSRINSTRIGVSTDAYQPILYCDPEKTTSPAAGFRNVMPGTTSNEQA